MADVILRGCCKFCKFSNFLKQHDIDIRLLKTKLLCSHPDNINNLKTMFMNCLTHENGYCEHFQWGDEKRSSIILKTFDNMKKE